MGAAQDNEAAVRAAIVRQRNRLNLTQTRLGTLAGTSQSCISELETGDVSPTLNTLTRILDAMDCDLVVVPRDGAAISLLERALAELKKGK